jgi:hypothetical protein
MPGAWIATIARRIAREDTFERMVSPAIADLQVEARSIAPLRLWRNYLSVAVVLMLAALHDLRLDLGLTFETDIRRVAWKRAAFWYAGGVLFFTWMSLRELQLLVIDEELWAAKLMSAGLGALASATQIAVVPLVVYLYRSSRSRRSAAAATLFVALTTIGLGLAVGPAKLSTDRLLYQAVQSDLVSSRGSVEWSASADASTRVKAIWLGFRSEDLDRSIVLGPVLGAASVISYALIGVVLARRRGWRVLTGIAGLSATWYLLVFTYFQLLGRLMLSQTQQRFRDVAMIALIALVWLAFESVVGRYLAVFASICGGILRDIRARFAYRSA